MCRLFALTSAEPVSPMRAIQALDVMREGHDGSGVGLFLTGLGGPLGELQGCPILSGILTKAGEERLVRYMSEKGFKLRHRLAWDLPATPPEGTPRRDVYLVAAYDLPEDWKGLPKEEIELRTMLTRIELKHMGMEKEDITVFSFWPDVVMVKEIGDPHHVGEYLNVGRKELYARHILAQGRQNTNYAINLYACHPFFIQGICTMTNGENTAFVPIKEYLMGRDVPGYEGYHSDSEVFTHILHYATRRLGLPLEAYKHVITPLGAEEMAAHPDGPYLANMKNVCRKMIIDGPNCVIGCLPDKSMFMVQDRKKLRPGVVGGRPGIYAFSSEICGLDAAIPERDKTTDFQPMHLDTVIVEPDCQEMRICRQTQQLPQAR